MPELRAPDPTLDAIEPDAPIGLDYSEGAPLIAHIVYWVNREMVPECAPPEFGGLETIEARNARWFAVPCRECFPDAPPPGHEFWTLIHQDNSRTTETRPAAGLSWQMGDV